jgi:hypothetical protein
MHALRIPNPTLIDFSLHLANFVKRIPNEYKYIIVTTIASILYLDNFPPGAYNKSLPFQNLRDINIKQFLTLN